MKKLLAMAVAGLLAIGSSVTIFAASPAAKAVTKPGKAAVEEGEALFIQRCGYCHLPGGTGSIQLERRWGKSRALLAQRNDLSADYVTVVARRGLYSMPPISKVEVSDSELQKLAEYLANTSKEAGKP